MNLLVSMRYLVALDERKLPSGGRGPAILWRTKQDNCQVAVSVSLACAEGSLPVA